MSAFFVDTSALAKRYLIETGSQWVKTWTLPQSGNLIVVAELTLVEMFSLLARRQREKTISATSTARLRLAFLGHVRADYLVVNLDSTILTSARNLTLKYPLRALDSIQLACALHALTILTVPITFISADNNLLSSATAEGFTIDNPNNHP